MTDFMKMLQQAQQVTGRIKEVQEALGKMSITGASGGGMVTAEVDGNGNIRKLDIEHSVVNPADVEMLEDLITVAIQEAQKKAKEAAEAEMKKAAGGMGLGSLPFKLPF